MPKLIRFNVLCVIGTEITCAKTFNKVTVDLEEAKCFLCKDLQVFTMLLPTILVRFKDLGRHCSVG